MKILNGFLRQLENSPHLKLIISKNTIKIKKKEKLVLMANLKSQERNFWEYFKKIVKGEQKLPFFIQKVIDFYFKIC